MSFVDPEESQREMEAAAHEILMAAKVKLAGCNRKLDVDEYDRARADVRAAQDALDNVLLFGPGA